MGVMAGENGLQRVEQTQNPLRIEHRFDPFEPGLLGRLPEPPRKVAVLRASRIGDFINATPAFRALRRALPNARIDVITLPMLKDLAERCPSVDRCLPFPGYPGLADQLFDAREVLGLLSKCAGRALRPGDPDAGVGGECEPLYAHAGRSLHGRLCPLR